LPVLGPAAQLSSKKRRTAQFRADFFVFALLCRLACEPNELVAEDRDDEIFTETFSGTTSYNYLRIEKDKLVNKKRQLTVPNDFREYIAIYSTVFDDVFSLEYITHDEIAETKEVLHEFSELEIEQILQPKDNSTFIEKQKMVKIRKLDRAIGDNLKIIYGYKCQICGLFIGETYDATVIHTHHIEYFSVSLNNNADNIMVICPNHHGIIHAANPIFDKKNKVYKYPNGYIEGLKLNLNL
jgi:predicted HNH restriction endonuclease